MTDEFPEAFKRYLGGHRTVRGKGIRDFQLLLDDVQQWGIKSPKGGMTYKQKRAIANLTEKEHLDNFYITTEYFRNGKVRVTHRDPHSGLFVSPETGTTKELTPNIWFDGKYWRDEAGHFAKAPLREDRPI